MEQEKFKNEKRNKWIILLIVVLFFITAYLSTGCKKKNTTPEPCPEPSTTTTGSVPVCDAKLKRFLGTFVFLKNTQDTIVITYFHNNCPDEYSGFYKVKGLGAALMEFAAPNTSFGDSLLTFKSEEINKICYHNVEQVTLKWDSLQPNSMKIVCAKLHNYSTTNYGLYKIK